VREKNDKQLSYPDRLLRVIDFFLVLRYQEENGGGDHEAQSSPATPVAPTEPEERVKRKILEEHYGKDDDCDEDSDGCEEKLLSLPWSCWS